VDEVGGEELVGLWEYYERESNFGVRRKKTLGHCCSVWGDEKKVGFHTKGGGQGWLLKEGRKFIFSILCRGAGHPWGGSRR